jgi:hypothetical protein
LQGQWQASGAISGYVVQFTQTGQSVSGTLYMEYNGLPATTLSGSDANGSVTLKFGFYLHQLGTNGIGPLPAGESFTGHFDNANTVEGTVGGQQLRLTRLSTAIVFPN